MEHPNFKVTITHDGVDADYVNIVFSTIQVKHRENNYDVATLTCTDENSTLYLSSVDVFDEIKIYFKDVSDALWTQVFGGNIRQANPVIGNSSIIQVLCKGYGAALEETNCNRDYGAEAQEIPIIKLTKSTAKEIWQDLVDNYVNLSLGSANPTGYAITKTKIADIASATPIKYINNPYKTNKDVVDTVCALTSAIGAGITAGAHWIVDNNKNLIINTIGLHENTTEWPDWWNVNEANSTLTQGIDFTNFTILDKSEEFSNNVVLITDFRRPAYDYWTEDSGGAALWQEDGFTISDSNVEKVVGSHSLLFVPRFSATDWGYFPKTADANWNVTRWGSEKTVPTLDFYMWKYHISTVVTYVVMSTNTTARKTDYFRALFASWEADPESTWIHKSIPIGPYWASKELSNQLRWGTVGTPLWTKIDSVEFTSSANDTDGLLYIDNLHFSGKIMRSAKNSTNITANNEFQKILISRNSMDNAAKWNDDTGFAARIAYAELLRRMSLPTTIVFQTEMHPEMMAGQKCHIHACKTATNTFKVDAVMRMLMVQHDLSMQGATTTVTATTDLKNSSPISVPDQYAMWQENMFLNSKEAKNIRSGSEVDLLIPIMQKDYP